MLVLLNVMDIEDTDEKYNIYESSELIPETIKYFNVLIGHHRIFTKIDNYGLDDLLENDCKKYILVRPNPIYDRDDTERFDSIEEFVNLHKNSDEIIYVMNDTVTDNQAFDMCDILMVTQPYESINDNNYVKSDNKINNFILSNISSLLKSITGLTYRHMIYTKINMKIVEMV